MYDLTSSTLDRIPAAVNVPTYDRSALRNGIVHLGVGHFHRSHQAMYVDQLLRQGTALDWGICGGGVRPGDRRVRDALAAQDYLYTLTVKEPDGSRPSRVIGSVNGYRYGAELIESLADPAIRIVSLTITEGGYGTDPVTGDFTGASTEIQADLRDRTPSRTVFGLVLQAMRLRRDRGAGGLTIMSCDNIEHNGSVAASAFLGFAEAADQGVARWMRANVAFPSSMVDRVTPGTVDADRAYVESAYGYRDRWPVTCEPFHQWVLEETFAAGRPPLEDAGVEVVGDVEPYELMKLRLANGTHQALCYFGCLLGHTYVHEAIADPDVRALLAAYLEEAVPTLRPIAGVDPRAYGRTVLERFGNAEMRDPLARICADTSDRIPKFVLPVVAAQLERGGPVRACAAVVASWARYAEGTDEAGHWIDVVDPRRDQLTAAAQRQASNPTAFIEDESVFGALANSPRFASAYTEALELIRTKGTRTALRELTMA
ncbi:mannitol dehydrogenase family protein [Kribbella sp. NPDC059898]|uniref:mannitol dehydrogenase family protein n=1 Tax=Kribbella sp. NPDC059898 TaxID=3346995 RepID=UPI003659B234